MLNGTGRNWSFSWCRRFFVWEEQLLLKLLEDSEGHVWNGDEDVWLWKREDGGVFMVKSMYTKLEGFDFLENN